MECCICYKLSKYKTCCNHDVCITCYNHLKFKDCPICRKQNIEIVNHKQISVQEYCEDLPNKLRFKFITYSIKRFIKTKAFRNAVIHVERNKKKNKYVNEYFGFYYYQNGHNNENQFILYDQIVSFEHFRRIYERNCCVYLTFDRSLDTYKTFVNSRMNSFFLMNLKHHKDELDKCFDVVP